MTEQYISKLKTMWQINEQKKNLIWPAESYRLRKHLSIQPLKLWCFLEYYSGKTLHQNCCCFCGFAAFYPRGERKHTCTQVHTSLHFRHSRKMKLPSMLRIDSFQSPGIYNVQKGNPVELQGLFFVFFFVPFNISLILHNVNILLPVYEKEIKALGENKI